MKRLLSTIAAIIALCAFLPLAFASTKEFQVNTLSGGSLTTGLVSYYNMQGNSNDYFGANNGTDTGVSYSSAYGRIGEGAAFGSSSAKIDVGQITSPTSSITIAVWVDNLTTANYFGIVGKYRNTGSVFTYLIQTWNGGTGDLQFNYSLDGSTNSSVLSTHHYTWTGWHFIVAELTTGGTGYIYVDNTLDNSGSIGSGTLNYSGSYDTLIGNRQDNLAQFPGYIDEVGIWSWALNANERTDLYNADAGQTMCTVGGSPACPSGGAKHKIIVISFNAKPEHPVA